MERKVYVETLGCQMNKSDSERILGILEEIGYKETVNPKNADLLIINTCSIRAASEDKAYSYLGVWGKWKKSNPNIKIAMCGCVAQQTKENVFRRAPYIDLIFGTHNINELAELIKKLESQEKICSVLKSEFFSKEHDLHVKRKDQISAWVPVIEGCDYFCTYCIVPYTRGRQRSRKPEDIINEAKEAAKEGFKEIVLLGQTVDSYGKDFNDKNIDLANLLKEINTIEDVVRIRFTTSHPADITDELIDTVSKLEKVCEYFHIPMQSGSTTVLKRMKRPYTRDEYISLIKKIRAKMPDVGITTDFIAGFPGETPEQFEKTLSIIEEINFDHCNTAAYSPRRQTPAAVWKDQLSREVKKERLNILNNKVKESTKIANGNYVGKTVEVLVENFSEKDESVILNGRTRSNKIVHFFGDKSLMGSLIWVTITGASSWCFKGKI